MAENSLKRWPSAVLITQSANGLRAPGRTKLGTRMLLLLLCNFRGLGFLRLWLK